MSGYILEIIEESASDKDDFFSGLIYDLSLPSCNCPNCGELMFPVVNIRYEAISEQGLLNQKISHEGYITLDVCASCSHSLRNYYVTFEGNKKIVVGGYVDNNGPTNKMDKPYESRAIKITEIPGWQWSDEDFVDRYHQRQLFDGVYHQYGGVKLKKERTPIDSCMCCGGELKFIAVIDNDDLNVPLYENGEPRALVIGDQRSINVFACNKCFALNYCITE